MTSEHAELGVLVRRGLAWSTVNNLLLRLASLAVGIVLARLLTPEQFGVYAVALTVQTVLMTLADLGLSADLIRSKEPARKAPTVATLGLLSGSGLALAMAVSAPATAKLLGSPEAAPVLAVMAGSLLMAGAGVVPYASLQRAYAQKKLFIIALVDFTVGTSLTILLVLSGWGVMALAVSRVVAQAASLTLQYLLSGERPKFGFDRSLAPSVLRYGLPVAGANLLSWALLTVDNLVVARLAGLTALGFYFLAFNISNWPMSAIGQIVRSVALPTFARVARGRSDRTFAAAVAPVWALSLFAGLMLAVLAGPLIELVYGARWLPATPALMALGLFGAFRPFIDLAASYLLARGRSMLVLAVQAVWLVTLVGALVAGVTWGGIVGAGVAHLVAALVVVLPAYFVALHRSGANVAAVFSAMWPPAAAALPAGVVAFLVTSFMPGPLLQLVLGGLAGLTTFGVLLGRWMRVQLATMRELSTMTDADEAAAATPGVLPPPTRENQP